MSTNGHSNHHQVNYHHLLAAVSCGQALSLSSAVLWPHPQGQLLHPHQCFYPAVNEDGGSTHLGLSYCPTMGSPPTNTLGMHWFLLLIDGGILSAAHQWTKTCCHKHSKSQDTELQAMISVRKKEAWAVYPHLFCPYIFAKYPEGHPFSFRLWSLQNQTGAPQQKYARKGICCPQCATGITWHHHSLALPQGISVFVLLLLKKLTHSQNRALVPQKELEDKQNLWETKQGSNDLLYSRETTNMLTLKKLNCSPKML